MPTLVQRIRTFLGSPRGQMMIERGRRELAKPETQQRLRRVLARFSGRR
ncbi:hypothetical protein AB0J86_15905 [Micromonospora sp. NPDC049559]